MKQSLIKSLMVAAALAVVAHLHGSGPVSQEVDAGQELISGDVFSHFQPTKQWHRVAKVSMGSNPNMLEAVSDESGLILMNSKEKTKGIPYLLTKDSYGDAEVTVEFMIPKDSNAGIYLMGRYEVQIFDSYGKEKLEHSDMGGIYQRWREMKDLKPGENAGGYEGAAPLVNATKAPGEWQRLDILFRAPRFDAYGRKTEVARFLAVRLNGHVVQKNVEVTGPTRSSLFKDEAAKGPVSIQGDHGPVAIRSFIIKPLADQE